MIGASPFGLVDLPGHGSDSLDAKALTGNQEIEAGLFVLEREMQGVTRAEALAAVVVERPLTGPAHACRRRKRTPRPGAAAALVNELGRSRRRE